MNDKYVVKNGRRLRRGYTTGTCAAAAAKGAAVMLLSGEVPVSVSVDTPAGYAVEFALCDAVITAGYAECSVVKDAGDDPDVTDGMKIFCRVERMHESGVKVTGGRGIGVVTRKGLAVQPGEFAINPVPLRMIRDEVAKVNPGDYGLLVTVSVPGGEEIAKKTFNPKLGIEGGISILGTTGIVEPVSVEAVKDSLSLELSMLKEQGVTSIILVPGNYGRDFAVNEYSLPPGRIVSAGNYMGYMLEQAAYYGMEKILLLGHIGKMIKIAGGNFDTHSRVSDSRVEIIAANYAYIGGEMDAIRKIMRSATTEEALEYVDCDRFYQHIVERIKTRAVDHIRGDMNIESVIFSMEKGFLAWSSGAETLVKQLGGVV